MTPVTIKTMKTSSLDKKDDVFKVNGVELSQITFVGRIERMQEQSMNFTYTIEDGTGRIDVKVTDTSFVTEIAFDQHSQTDTTSHLCTLVFLFAALCQRRWERGNSKEDGKLP